MSNMIAMVVPHAGGKLERVERQIPKPAQRAPDRGPCLRRLP